MQQWDHREHCTPPRETEAECWREIAEFMKREGERKIVFLRVPPEVNSDYDFPKAVRFYRGYVRFAVSPEEVIDKTSQIPGFGDG